MGLFSCCPQRPAGVVPPESPTAVAIRGHRSPNNGMRSSGMVIKGIPMSSASKTSAHHRSSDRMVKPKRKILLLMLFIVVTAIVLLSSVISDITFKSKFASGLQRAVIGKINSMESSAERLRLTAGLKKLLYPIKANPASVEQEANSTSSEDKMRNATISGYSVLKSKLRNAHTKHISSRRYFTSTQGGRKGRGDNNENNIYTEAAVLYGDPLVIETKVDHSKRRVPFLDPESRVLWNGRQLVKDYGGKKDIKDDQYFFLQSQLQTGGLNISHLSEFSLADQMLPWEWDMYAEPPLADIADAGSELHSRMSLVHPPNGPYTVGDVVVVRVDVFDSRGRPKTQGGDEVRVWMKEEAFKAGSGFDVQDMRNGSYLAVGKLLWPGRPEIRASLAYPREIIRTVYYLRNVMKGLRLNAGGFATASARIIGQDFQKKNAYATNNLDRLNDAEATICSPFPFSGVYRHLCNLTSLNYGLSWYCGRPGNPRLSCRDWIQIRDLEFPNPLPINAEERKWFYQLAVGTKHSLRLLNKTRITFDVLPSKEKVISSSACSRRPPRDTWQDRAPRGFILHSQWLPLACSIPVVDINYVNQCLKGSTLHMVGDSNLRHMMEMMVFLGLCHPTKPLLGRKNWHRPQKCINHENYYVVKWMTHALPFHTNNDHWASRTNQRAVGLSLDSIPSTGRHIVLLHMYLHFTTHHYSVYRERIRSMRDAVARLLRRNPAAKVVIRGPHVSYGGWDPTLGGDVQAPRYMDMLKEEFKSLYDKVYLLDFWDFSIAAENKGFHPERQVTQEMLRTFFGYVCDVQQKR